MRNLAAHPRLLGLILVGFVLCATVIIALAAFSRVEAQTTQNKTMRALVESLIARQKANKGFVFSVKPDFSIYNSGDINFEISNSDTTIVDLGDDHICVVGTGTSANAIFCYPYTSITLAYAK